MRAIRTRLGVSTAYQPEDMAAAISGITGTGHSNEDCFKFKVIM